jgi:hypothetical protein
MTVSPEVVTGEIARHHIANLLYSYVDIADRKDVTAAVGLLGSARVVSRPAGTRRWTERRRSSPRCGRVRSHTDTTSAT